MNPFSLLIAPVSKMIEAYQNNKRAKVEAKTAVEMKMAELSKQDSNLKAQWELVKAENESGTWKDEYVVLVLTAPYVLSLVLTLVGAVSPLEIDVKQLVEDMFAPMQAVPAYWENGFLAAVFTSLGIKFLGSQK